MAGMPPTSRARRPLLTQDVNGVASGAPTLQTAVSRKVHGAAGTFDLPLSLIPTNPSTEPRAGPAATVVLTFNKALTGATVTVTEGTATAAAPTISGNDVVVDLTGVADQQFVTVTLSNVASTDGFSGGSGSVRIAIPCRRRQPEPGGHAVRRGGIERATGATGDGGELPAGHQRQRDADSVRQGHCRGQPDAGAAGTLTARRVQHVRRARPPGAASSFPAHSGYSCGEAP